MVQVIEQQGGLFGQLGKGFGQGLSEQLPKEMDRYRLSEGLKKLGEQQDLTPFQQFAGLSSVPGITPQMIQSGSELLKQQGMRNAYQRMAGQGSQDQIVQPQDKFQNVPFAGIKSKNPQSKAALQEEIGGPQVVEKNPLRKEAEPAKAWTPERHRQEVAKIFNEVPGISLPEAINTAKENEARMLAQPQGEQAIDAYQQQVQERLQQKFGKSLEEKLQKAGEKVYNDVTGETLNNLKRGMERELRLNPNATEADVVDRWTTKALDLSKTKNQLKTLAQRDLIKRLNPLLKEETFNSLKSYQKQFAETGNTEEFFNLMKSDFQMSPQGAASIAYPRSPEIRKFVNSVKHSNYKTMEGNSRRYADEVKNKVTSDDSFLAIARDLQDKDNFFNSTAFFEELMQDQEMFTRRQKDEIAQGANASPISWGDLLIFPFIKGDLK